MKFSYIERDIYKPCVSDYIKSLHCIEFSYVICFHNSGRRYDISNKFKFGYYPIILDFTNSPPLDSVQFYCFMAETFGDYLKNHNREQFYSDFIVVGSEGFHKEINNFINLKIYDMAEITRDKLISDFCEKVIKVYRDDTSCKGRDYTFRIDWDMYKDSYHNWVSNKELEYTTFLLFWNECIRYFNELKQDGDLMVGGLTDSEEFLFDLAYKQVKEYYANRGF